MILKELDLTRLLISRADIDRLARPCLADDIEAERFIAEAELIDLAPQIGGELFAEIKSHPEDHRGLLDGGAWEDDCGKMRMFAGLRTSLAYYAFARIVRNAGQIATRFGYTEKRDEYSNQVELRQRTAQANEAYTIAVEHLRNCMDYMRANKELYGDICRLGVRNTATPRYRVIRND